jgi:integrase
MSVQPYGKNGWRAQVTAQHRGVILRDSATFEHKRAALAWRDDRKRELLQQLKDAASGQAGRGKTLAHAFARYAAEVAPGNKGARTELLRLGKLATTLPMHRPLAELTPADLNDWKTARLRRVKPGSVLREISQLGSVLSYCRRDWAWMQHNPLADVRRPRAPRHRTRTITGPELRAMLRALGHVRGHSAAPDTIQQVLALAFLFALATGMRDSEILGLEWARVLPTPDRPTHLHLPETKNGAPRDVPLSATACRILARLRAFERPFDIKASSRDALFRSARARAGLAGFTFHDARHTAATRIGATVGQPGRLSFPLFCKVFGWKDPKQALVYVNPRAADLAGMV